MKYDCSLLEAGRSVMADSTRNRPMPLPRGAKWLSLNELNRAAKTVDFQTWFGLRCAPQFKSNWLTFHELPQTTRPVQPTQTAITELEVAASGEFLRRGF
jgi:hypothetical protein